MKITTWKYSNLILMRYLHININTLYRVIPLAVLRMSPHSVSALVQLRGSTTVNWPGPAPPSSPAHTIAEVLSSKPCNTQYTQCRQKHFFRKTIKMTATAVSGKVHSGNYQHHLVAPWPQCSGWSPRHHGNLSGHNSELSGALSLHSYLVICSPLWLTSHHFTTLGD